MPPRDDWWNDAAPPPPEEEEEAPPPEAPPPAPLSPFVREIVRQAVAARNAPGRPEGDRPPSEVEPTPEAGGGWGDTNAAVDDPRAAVDWGPAPGAPYEAPRDWGSTNVSPEADRPPSEFEPPSGWGGPPTPPTSPWGATNEPTLEEAISGGSGVGRSWATPGGWAPGTPTPEPTEIPPLPLGDWFASGAEAADPRATAFARYQGTRTAWERAQETQTARTAAQTLTPAAQAAHALETQTAQGARRQ